VARKSNRARSIGGAAEESARRKYGLETDNGEAWDLRHPSNGFKYEVKACRTYRAEGERPGRFRFWESAHNRFMQERGAYILVVYSRDSEQIWRIEKVPQERVHAAVSGNWYGSGHRLKDDDRQYKLSWREIL
jgi:hypothetical protein